MGEDSNKGDDNDPNVRCRLLAREIRKAGEDPIFASTPPLESLRTILSLAATDFHGVAKKIRDPKERRQYSGAVHRHKHVLFLRGHGSE